MLDPRKTALSPFSDHYELYISTVGFARRFVVNTSLTCPNVYSPLLASTRLEETTLCGHDTYKVDVPTDCRTLGNQSQLTLYLEASLLFPDSCQFQGVAAAVSAPAALLLPRQDTHEIVVTSFLSWKNGAAYSTQVDLVVFNPCPQYFLLSNTSEVSFRESLRANGVVLVDSVGLVLMDSFVSTILPEQCWTVQFLELHFSSLNCSTSRFELGFSLRLMWGVHDLSENFALAVGFPSLDGCDREIVVGTEVEFVLTNLLGSLVVNETGIPVPLEPFRTGPSFSMCVFLQGLPAIYGNVRWLDFQLYTEANNTVPFKRLPSLNANPSDIKIYTEEGDMVLLHGAAFDNHTYCFEFNFSEVGLLNLHFNLYSELLDTVVSPDTNFALSANSTPANLAMETAQEEGSPVETSGHQQLVLRGFLFLFIAAAVVIVATNKIRKTERVLFSGQENLGFYFVE